MPGGYVIPILSCFVCLWFLSNISKYEYLSISLYILIITSLYIFIKIKNKNNYELIEQIITTILIILFFIYNVI